MKVSSGYDAIREELSTYPVPNESGCAGFVYVVLMCCLSRETKFVRGLFRWPREQDILTVGVVCEVFLQAVPVYASLIAHQARGRKRDPTRTTQAPCPFETQALALLETACKHGRQNAAVHALIYSLHGRAAPTASQ